MIGSGSNEDGNARGRSVAAMMRPRMSSAEAQLITRYWQRPAFEASRTPRKLG
jgi:hypothetical protein